MDQWGLQTIVEGDLAFNPIDGLLYGIQETDATVVPRNLFRINPNTGAATVIGDVGGFGNTTDYSSLAFSNIGTLFTIDSAGMQNSKLLTLDPANGQILSTITMNVNLGGAVGMTFDPISGTAYVADSAASPASGGTNSVYTIDVLTGVTALIGPTGDPHGISGLAFIPVPEPSSFLLAGFAGLLASRRFRRLCKAK